MTAEAKEILVAFGIDAGYAPHLAAALASIVANAPGARFRFMVIHDGVPEEEQWRIETAAPTQTFDWREVVDSRLLGLEGNHHISRATFYRFAIPVFAAPEVERAIYLDSDLIVLGDLRELIKVDLGDTMLGAVFDPGADVEAFAQRMRNEVTPKPLAYFNAGVLLLDLAKIRASGAFEAAVRLALERADELVYGDQDVLNYVLWDQWTRLDPMWNAQRRMLLQEGRACYASTEEMQIGRRPKIIHFTEEVKPWSKDGYHPLIWTYYRYLRRTPYWKRVNEKAGNSTIKHVRRLVRTSVNLSRLKA